VLWQKRTKSWSKYPLREKNEWYNFSSVLPQMPLCKNCEQLPRARYPNYHTLNNLKTQEDDEERAKQYLVVYLEFIGSFMKTYI